MSLNTDIESFIEFVGAKSENTAKTYRAAIDHLLRYLDENGLTPDASPALLTPEMFHRYPAWLMKQTWQPNQHADPRPLGENTCALYFVAAGNLLRYLAKLKRLAAFDPGDIEAVRDTLRRTTAPKRPPIHQKLPSDEIVDALIAAARVEPAPDDDVKPSAYRRALLTQRRNLAILVTLQRTGLRVSELVALRRKDLNLAKQGAYVAGKGRKIRFVPLHDEVLSEIQTYLDLRHDGELMLPLADHPVFCRHDKRASDSRRLPLTTRSVWDIVDSLMTLANLTERFHCSPHSLRHYFATRLLDKTGDLSLVQDALGHSDPKTTRIYAKGNEKKLADAVRGLD